MVAIHTLKKIGVLAFYFLPLKQFDPSLLNCVLIHNGEGGARQPPCGHSCSLLIPVLQDLTPEAASVGEDTSIKRLSTRSWLL